MEITNTVNIKKGDKPFKNYKSNSRSYSRYSGRSGSYGNRSYSRSSSTSRSYTPRTYSKRSSTLKTRSHNGYSQFYNNKKGNWQFTHRRVAEKKIGGSIPRGHEVHHINQNKSDNRPSNLSILTKYVHRSIHRKGGFFSRLFKKNK